MQPFVQSLCDSQAIVYRSSIGEMHWQSMRDPFWSLADAGPMSGAILVERMRTFRGQLSELKWNLERLKAGLEWMGWESSKIGELFLRMVHEVVERNASSIRSLGDVSVVFLVSPDQEGWMLVAHLAEVPTKKLATWYREGVHLVTTSIALDDHPGVPTNIKHRSRIAYWVADQQAQKKEPGSVAMLRTASGFLADTSIANLVIEGPTGEWFTPSASRCHLGTTLRRTCSMLQESGRARSIEERDLKIDDLERSRGAVLLGTTGVVLPVSRLDGMPLAGGVESAIGKELRDLWSVLGYSL